MTSVADWPSKGKILGRKQLEEFGTLFTTDTIFPWHRQLVAQKWDHSQKRKSLGRPRIRQVIVDLILRFAKEYSRVVKIFRRTLNSAFFGICDSSDARISTA